jgi:hypothetical protein
MLVFTPLFLKYKQFVKLGKSHSMPRTVFTRILSYIYLISYLSGHAIKYQKTELDIKWAKIFSHKCRITEVFLDYTLYV